MVSKEIDLQLEQRETKLRIEMSDTEKIHTLVWIALDQLRHCKIVYALHPAVMTEKYRRFFLDTLPQQGTVYTNARERSQLKTSENLSGTIQKVWEVWENSIREYLDQEILTNRRRVSPGKKPVLLCQILYTIVGFQLATLEEHEESTVLQTLIDAYPDIPAKILISPNKNDKVRKQWMRNILLPILSH